MSGLPLAVQRRRDAWLRLFAYSVLVVPLVSALVVSFAVTPEDIESGRVVLSPACAFKRLFGHGCPTCGLTRAFSALSHGRWADAIDYHVASPVLYVLWCAGVVVGLLGVAGAVRDVRRAVLEGGGLSEKLRRDPNRAARGPERALPPP